MDFINNLLDYGAYTIHKADAFCAQSIGRMSDRTFKIFYNVIGILVVLLMVALFGVAGTLETSSASDAFETYFAEAVPIALSLAVLTPAVNHCYTENQRRKPRHFR